MSTCWPAATSRSASSRPSRTGCARRSRPRDPHRDARGWFPRIGARPRWRGWLHPGGRRHGRGQRGVESARDRLRDQGRDVRQIAGPHGERAGRQPRVGRDHGVARDGDRAEIQTERSRTNRRRRARGGHRRERLAGDVAAESDRSVRGEERVPQDRLGAQVPDRLPAAVADGPSEPRSHPDVPGIRSGAHRCWPCR